MKFLLSIVTVLLFTACSTTVTQKMPTAPAALLVPCTKLKTLDPADKSQSTAAKVINENYTESKKCSQRVDSWIEWYDAQQRINH